MFRSANDAAAERPGPAHQRGTDLKAIGAILTLNGSANVIRASGSTVPVYVGISVFQGDVIVTGDDGAVGVTFEDGSVFCLGASTRMVLDEFICDRDGTLSSALFRFLQGTFHFITGRIARSDGISIDTPFATIRNVARGGGLGVLTLTAFTFAALKEIQAASQNAAFLDDDALTYQDLEHGTFEIVTKEPNPRTFMVDNPGVTVVIRPGTGGAFNVEQAANSASRMAELQAASQEAAATFLQGQTDSFIRQHRRADIDGDDASGSIIRHVGASGSEGLVFSQLLTTDAQNSSNSGGLAAEFAEIDPSDPTFFSSIFIPPSQLILASNLALGSAGSLDVVEIFGVTGSSAFDTVAGSLPFTGAGSIGGISVSLVSTTWSVADLSVPDNLVGMLSSAMTASVTAGGSGAGAVNFVFRVPDHTFDFLANGETLVVTYNLTISDGVSSSTQPISIVIAGTNDGPTISAATTAGAVGEDVLATSVNGTTDFTDVDLTDTHIVSAAPAAGGYLGTFTPAIADVSSGDGVGQVTWSFGVLNADLQFLAAGQTLTQTYTVTVDDGEGGTVSQLVTITITGSNDGATITGTVTGGVVEDGALTTTGTLTVSDIDTGEAELVPIPAGAGAYGTFVVLANGQWTYTLNNELAAVQALPNGITLTDTITVTSEDGTATQLITITITGTNGVATIAGAVSGDVVEDTTLTVSGVLTVTDEDTGEAELVPIPAGAGAYGTFVVLANGQWTYTLNNELAAVQALPNGITLTDTITVTSEDGTATQLITITITGTNGVATIAGAVSGDVVEDTTLTVSGVLTVTDEDTGEAELVPIPAGAGAYGTFVVLANGQWTYTLNNELAAVQALPNGITLTDTITVTSEDGTATQLITITITGTNGVATIAGAVSGDVVEDTTLTVSGVLTVTDEDTGEAELVPIPAGAGAYGTFVVLANGQWTYTLNNELAAVQALPNGITLTDTITVTSEDGTATQLITITITGTNGVATIAGAVSGDVVEDTTLTVSGVLTVTDEDTGEAELVPIPAGAGAYGTFVVLANGQWTYTLNNELAAVQALPNGITLTDTITVTSEDGTATQLITITITGTNGVATIAGAVSGDVVEDTTLTVSGVLTVTDEDTGEAELVPIPAGAGAYGTFVVLANGQWTYTLNNELAAVQALPNGITLTDTITVTSEDGTATQLITITITGTNGVATIAGAVSGDVVEDTTLTVSGVLTVTDEDTGEAELVPIPAGAGAYGTFVVLANGQWTYTLNNELAAVQALPNGITLTDTITVTSEDGTATQLITITITGTNGVATIAGAVSGDVVEDTTLTVSGVLTVTDEDTGEAELVPIPAGAGAYGTFVVLANGQWTYTLNNELAAVQALPNGITLTDTITVTSEDGTATQLITITITGTNGVATIAGAVSGDVVEDTTLTVSGVLTVTDEDTGEAELVPIPAGAGAYGTFVVLANGQWTYTLNNELAAVQALPNGITLTDTITVTSEDGTATQLITITITGTNGVATIAGAVSGDVVEDTTLTVSGVLTVTDEDTGEAELVPIPAGAGAYGTFVVLANGQWTYTLNNELAAVQALPNGITLTDTITVTSEDGTATQLITITITGTNGVATIAGAVSGDVVEDTTLTVSGVLTVTDEDTGEAELVPIPAGAGAYGTFVVLANGQWTYTLNNELAAVQALPNGITLTDTITVTSEDGTATQLITITITGTNGVATIAGAVSGDVVEDTTLTVSGVLTVTDEDTGEAELVPIPAGAGAYGTFVVLANGQWTYTLNNELAAVQALPNGITLTDTITVTSEDGTATQLITITITGTNGVATIAGAVSGDVVEDTTLTVSGVLTVTDEDTGEAELVPIPAGAGAYGTFVVLANGQWTYTLNNELAAVQALPNGITLTDTITVTSEDGTATQLITITITGTNGVATIAGAVSGDVVEDTTLTVSGVLTVTDEDTGEAELVPIPAGAGAYGTFVVLANGQWTYTLNNELAAVQALPNGITLTDTITVTSEDGTDTQLITITITGTNGVATIAGAVSGGVVEDTTLTVSGVLTVTDEDTGEAELVPIPAGAGAYGTFVVLANGQWTYTLNNELAAVQALPNGITLTDTITVTSEDGTDTQLITITITGTNGVATIAGAVSGGVVENTTLTVSGVLTVTDEDTGQNEVQPIAAGTPGANSYGTFVVLANGQWTYTLDNTDPAVQALAALATLTDTILVTSEDGTDTQLITITITGTNGVATIAGAVSGGVVEDTTLTVSGVLTVTDEDTGQNEVQPIAAGTPGANSYGTFVVLANGQWTYTLDNTDPAVQALAALATLTDTILVTSEDGTDTQLITITITGTNGVATIAGAVSGGVVENTTLTVSGVLTVTDEDTGQNEVQPIAAGTPGANSYGTFVVLANGQWTYTLDNTDPAVQALAALATLTDTILVTSEDGTDTQLITITITGTNGVATIAGAVSGGVVEDTTLTVSGVLTVTDEDTGQNEVQPIAAGTPGANSYGTFVVLANGQWTYTLDNTDPAVQALAALATLTDTILVTSEDGTDTQLITITITGTNGVATIAGAVSGGVVEDTTLTVSGVLTVTDEDTGQNEVQPIAAGTPGANSYGTFVVLANGQWTYTLDNTDPAVQALAALATLTDTITVTSEDGTDTQLITITITGTNDGPALNDPFDFDFLVNGFTNPLGTLVLNTLFGTNGPIDDNLNGGNQDQIIYGGAGNDIINGGNQNDLIFAGSGDDVVTGQTQTDIIYGGSGNDTIAGNTQNDLIVGGFGVDLLTGGVGSDTFKFLSRLDTGDTITDFTAGVSGDRLDFSEINPSTGTYDPLNFGGTFGLFADVNVHLNSINYFQSGANTIIAADTDSNTLNGAELQITLTNVLATQIVQQNFLL